MGKTFQRYLESDAITSKYKECLRHVLHLPELRDYYMKKKWEWSDSTVDEIWLDVQPWYCFEKVKPFG